MTTPVRTPNYCLTSEVVVHLDRNASKTLPVGSFVRPIDARYVPQHVLDKFAGYDKVTQAFVYSRYGIVVVPRSFLRET